MIEDLTQLVAKIDHWSRELGFSSMGISDINLDSYAEKLDLWLEKKFHGDMKWIEDRQDLRAHPNRLVTDCIRCISFRFNYLAENTHPQEILSDSEKAYISRYALGRDYHRLIRPRLAQIQKNILQWCNENAIEEGYGRAFVDSAPVLEKPLAEKSGLGWIGKNTLLISEEAGSLFFLGEILTTLPLPITEKNIQDKCGKCKACLKVCPTDAFPEPYVLDARKCISYLTIESSDAIPVELRKAMGNRVFGCDDCQLVCPWNRYADHTDESDFIPRHGLDQSALAELICWTEEEFLKNTEGSAIRRTGYLGWLRNLAIGLGNGPWTHKAEAALIAAKGHSDMVDEHVEWALRELRNTRDRII